MQQSQSKPSHASELASCPTRRSSDLHRKARPKGRRACTCHCKRATASASSEQERKSSGTRAAAANLVRLTLCFSNCCFWRAKNLSPIWSPGTAKARIRRWPNERSSHGRQLSTHHYDSAISCTVSHSRRIDVLIRFGVPRRGAKKLTQYS